MIVLKYKCMYNSLIPNSYNIALIPWLSAPMKYGFLAKKENCVIILGRLSDFPLFNPGKTDIICKIWETTAEKCNKNDRYNVY